MRKQGILMISLSAILFGLIPILTSILYANGENAVSVSFYRYAFMLPVLWLLSLYKRLSLKIAIKDAWNIFLFISLFSTATMLLLNSSYVYVNTGVATTLHFLYPLFVILICRLFYHDKIDSHTKKSLLLILIGIACFLIHVEIESLIGIVLAFASSFTYAIYLVEMEKKRLSRLHPIVFSFHISLDTTILLWLFHLVLPSLQLPSYDAFLWLCILSITSLVALACLQLGSRSIGAKLTSLFSLFEPITSLIVGIVILKEEISIWKVIGCILIFIAVVYVAVGKPKNKEVKQEKEVHQNEAEGSCITD